MLPALAAYRALRTALKQGADPTAALAEIDRLESSSRLDFAIRELPQTIDDAMEGLTRVSQIVRSLKEFSHPGRTASSHFSVNRCVETTLSVSRHEWKYVADVDTQLAPDLPPVLGNSDEFNQVLLNLIVNAAHAIQEAQKAQGTSDKGRISITTRTHEQHVEVAIADTGHGIPDVELARIFERFYRVDKARSRDSGGTGLGLSIVASLIEAHGGTVTCRSAVGQGTTFTVVLPLAPQPVGGNPARP